MFARLLPQIALVTFLSLPLAVQAGGKQASQASPPFTGTALPVPPAQAKRWKPPAGVPDKLVDAAAALFDAGLADPREGEYRVIEVGTGSCWSGDAGVFRTHGWVLPAGAGARERYAVGWNGLVYPVVTVGERADLAADIRALVQADEGVRAKFARQQPGQKFYRLRHAWSEQRSLAADSLLPLKACLLARLGEGELAAAVWSAWTAGMHADVNDDGAHLRDPYLMLASDWAWALLDRTLGAHMRGDDRLALLGARALARIEPAIDGEAARRGFERPGASGPTPGVMPYLAFLGDLPRLLADQERRAAEAKAPPPAPAKGDQAARVRALVRGLQDVSARQWGQPGGVGLNTDGTVEALVREGEAAVEPLLKSLEQDRRLTRSVRFHRDFFRDRHVIPVRRAAYAALQGIFKMSSFGANDHAALDEPDGGRQLAAAIRAHWTRFKGVPLAERWYRTLADDRATPAEWLQAAQNIVRPSDVPPKIGERRALQGEVLRTKRDPSVTALLIKRIDGQWQPFAAETAYRKQLTDAIQLGYALSDWDPRAAAPVLSELIRLCRQYFAEEKQPDGNTFLFLGPAVARMTERRLAAGDPAALGHYASWLRGVGPKAASHSYMDVFAPMWEHPDDPDVKLAAEALFGDDRSPWAERFLRAFNTHDLIHTPMVGVAAFRKRVLVELADRRRAGVVKLGEDGVGSLTVDDGYSGGGGIHTLGDPRAPQVPAEAVFRVCDFYAWGISAIPGAPACELYWPEADRDRAVAGCAAFLKRYGERLKDTPDPPRDGYTVTTYPRLVFAALKGPATPQDVAQARAIFTLVGAAGAAGAADVRPVQLPTFPQRARWLEYQGARRILQHWDEKTKRAVYVAEPDREGVLWQAEEALVDGQWRRYYGFVGRHVIARVPAGEVEFLGDSDEAELVGGVNCRLSFAGLARSFDAVVGKPVPLEVWLRNRSGLDRPLPATVVGKRPDGKAALRAGVRLRLWYHPDPAVAGNPPSGAIARAAPWEELTPRDAAALPAAKAVRVPAGAEFTAGALDLADVFELSRVGSYKVRLDFRREDGGFAAGTSHELRFVLSER